MSESAPDNFTRVWAVYPRREAKKDARKAWHQVRADAHVDAILAAVAWQRDTDSWRRGYVPLFASYLRGERWMDEPPIDVIVPTARERTDYRQWCFSLGPSAKGVSIADFCRRQRKSA